jgi:hypothetical protein
MDLFNVFRKKDLSASSDKSDKMSSLEDPRFIKKVIYSSSGKNDYFDHQVVEYKELDLEKKKSLVNDKKPVEVLNHPEKEEGKRFFVSYVDRKTVEGDTWKDQGSDPFPPTIEVDSKTTDSIVFSVIEKFLQRSEFGMKKYGTNLDRTDLDVIDWIQHAQEQHMDAILYLEKLKTTLARDRMNPIIPH